MLFVMMFTLSLDLSVRLELPGTRLISGDVRGRPYRLIIDRAAIDTSPTLSNIVNLNKKELGSAAGQCATLFGSICNPHIPCSKMITRHRNCFLDWPL